MLYVKETTGSVELICKRVEQSAADNKFGVLGIHDLRDKMMSKGVPFDSECRVIEVCNPVQAKKILETDMTLSTALPCRISVYEEHGKVKIATIRPTAIIKEFGRPELLPVAQAVEDSLIRIIDSAVLRP